MFLRITFRAFFPVENCAAYLACFLFNHFIYFLLSFPFFPLFLFLLLSLLFYHPFLSLKHLLLSILVFPSQAASLSTLFLARLPYGLLQLFSQRINLPASGLSCLIFP